MDKELLEILVCPRTKKKLELAPVKILEKINTSIESGKCKDISGELVIETVEEGLYEADSRTFYLIRDGIPLLIYENAILTDDL